MQVVNNDDRVKLNLYGLNQLRTIYAPMAENIAVWAAHKQLYKAIVDKPINILSQKEVRIDILRRIECNPMIY